MNIDGLHIFWFEKEVKVNGLHTFFSNRDDCWMVYTFSVWGECWWSTHVLYENEVNVDSLHKICLKMGRMLIVYIFCFEIVLTADGLHIFGTEMGWPLMVYTFSVWKWGNCWWSTYFFVLKWGVDGLHIFCMKWGEYWWSTHFFVLKWGVDGLHIFCMKWGECWWSTHFLYEMRWMLMVYTFSLWKRDEWWCLHIFCLYKVYNICPKYSDILTLYCACPKM